MTKNQELSTRHYIVFVVIMSFWFIAFIGSVVIQDDAIIIQFILDNLYPIFGIILFIIGVLINVFSKKNENEYLKKES